MSVEAIYHATCDRCGERETDMSWDDLPENWTRLFIFVEADTDEEEEPIDLCTTCTKAFDNWRKTTALKIVKDGDK